MIYVSPSLHLPDFRTLYYKIIDTMQDDTHVLIEAEHLELLKTAVARRLEENVYEKKT